MIKHRGVSKKRIFLLKGGPTADPESNLREAVEKARRHLPAIGDEIEWSHVHWQLDNTLFQEIARVNYRIGIAFKLPPLYNSRPLEDDWADAAKTMFINREMERHKTASSHRTFLTVVGFVAQSAGKRPLKLLTREIIDRAGDRISESSPSERQVYKLHNLLHEFVRRCVIGGFCYASLGDYRYANRRRPDNYGGRAAIRIDSSEVMMPTSTRVIGLRTYAVLGELYRNVPRAHKYRIFLLVITLLACTGRRLSEISTLPRQRLQITENGAFLKYLKLKGARGSQQRTLVRVPILTMVLPLVQQVLTEIEGRSADYYAIAEEMCRVRGPDLRFLDGVEDDEPLYLDRLLEMGMPANMFSSNGCFYWSIKSRKEVGVDRKMRSGYQLQAYVYKADVEHYCRAQYNPQMTEPLYHADGTTYFLKDILLLNYLGNASGHYCRWLVTIVKEGAFRNFLKNQLELLAGEYATSNFTERFTSHDFRHTLNDALDKGNLPDIMQSEFFGRARARDNKSYQHTSSEQRALAIRSQIKLGQVGGKVAELVMRAPADRREALLMSATRAVHDVGAGFCFHAWHTGPCTKHRECDTDCEEFGYVISGEDGDQRQSEVSEIRRQLCHNFMTLEVASSLGVHQRAAQWVEHTRRKIESLLVQLDQRGEKFDFLKVGEYIIGANLDGVDLPSVISDTCRGYGRFIMVNANSPLSTATPADGRSDEVYYELKLAPIG